MCPMSVLEKRSTVNNTLPVVHDVVRAAQSGHRLLDVNAEAQRLLRTRPELQISLDELAEQIVRVAVAARVAMKVG
jgi:hypothetical protein